VSTFDIAPNPNLGDAMPIIGASRTPVMTSAEFYGVKAPAPRPDHRGEHPSRAAELLPPGGTPSRGPTQRRYISREEALAQQIARQASQQAEAATAAANAVGPRALTEAVADLQAAVAALRTLTEQQAAVIEQQQARIDSLEGGGTGDAA